MSDEAKPNRPQPETADVIEAYHSTAEWIRFGDAKAAVVLTVNGALASVLIPTVQPIVSKLDNGELLPIFAVVLFGAWLVLTALSAVYAFRCILPIRQKGKHPALDACKQFHPASISAHYTIHDTDRFQADFEAAGDQGLREQIVAGLLIDSHVSALKYWRVTASIRVLGVAASLGFAYLVLAQLV